MVSDYFEYERRIAREHLVPWLQKHRALPTHGQVLDVGCGYGGTLAALKEVCPNLSAVGLDLDASMTSEGQKRLGDSAELIHADFFQWSSGTFDLILMRDVLEHIRDPEAALSRVASMLAKGGRLFVSFAPFYGPFGGHQHNAAGPFAAVPWLQCLPERMFRKLLPIAGNSYKSKAELELDMESVLETRLTMRRFVLGARAADLRVEVSTAYLSRPDYKSKFGLPTVRLPSFSRHEEVLTTGVEALLQQARR